MISGIGTDICDISRIKRVLDQFPERFPARILTPSELNVWQKKQKNIAWLSLRFAAKEAIVKAMGTGFRYGLSFQDFSLTNTRDGAPMVTLSAKAQTFIPKNSKVYISLSDEKGYALAFCVVEQTEEYKKGQME